MQATLRSPPRMRVEVSDINDNAPRFTRPVYTARIKDNNIIGASMFSVTAFDPDVGQNARLHFSLAPAHFQTPYRRLALLIHKVEKYLLRGLLTTNK